MLIILSLMDHTNTVNLSLKGPGTTLGCNWQQFYAGLGTFVNSWPANRISADVQAKYAYKYSPHTHTLRVHRANDFLGELTMQFCISVETSKTSVSAYFHSYQKLAVYGFGRGLLLCLDKICL